MCFKTERRAHTYAEKFKKKQNQRNYRSEYERIRAHVEDSATPALNKDHLRDKMAHLNKKIGAKAVDSIR